MHTAPPSISLPAHAIGQAVFLRTGIPDYVEVTLAFQTLEELVRLCSEPRPGLTLERVVVFAMQDGQPAALTLGFISASKGTRLGAFHPEFKV
ncbi:MAG: hypothetical protein ABMA26_21325 [Limisphaerales bacterium]